MLVAMGGEMRLRYALALVAGCASSHMVAENAGRGLASVTTRDQATPGSAGSIQLARGTYYFDVFFDVPRAQVVDYTVTCPTVTRNGHVGQTFADYRERRLRELRAQAERDRRNAAAATSALVGAI